MIEVCVEVVVNGASLRLSVRAGSIRRASEIVQARYPSGDIRVVFPIQPESFFSRQADFHTERMALESTGVAA